MRSLLNLLAILSFCVILGALLGSLFTLGLAEIAFIIRPLRELIDWPVAVVTSITLFTLILLAILIGKKG
jgi:hypothetical protein